MGGIFRRDNDDYDDEGNGRRVHGLVGWRLCINNNDSLNNRSTTTKEGGWDPPHPGNAAQEDWWRTAANGTNV